MKKIKINDFRFLISLLIILPAWATVWWFADSQPHVLLGTNLITGVMAYWIGSSKGSQDKDAIIAQMEPVEHSHCCRDDEPVG